MAVGVNLSDAKLIASVTVNDGASRCVRRVLLHQIVMCRFRFVNAQRFIIDAIHYALL